MESMVVVGNVVDVGIVGGVVGRNVVATALTVVIVVVVGVLGISIGRLGVAVVISIVLSGLLVIAVFPVVFIIAAAVVVAVDVVTLVVAMLLAPCRKLTLSAAALSDGKVGKTIFTREAPPLSELPLDVAVPCVGVAVSLLLKTLLFSSLLVSSSSSKSASKSERSVVGRLLPRKAGNRLGPATRITWPIIRLTMPSICYNGKGEECSRIQTQQQN